MLYSIPYVILSLVLMALAVLNRYVLKTQRKWVVLAAYAILFVFFGFRGYIGDDWQNYYPFFNDIQFSDLSFSYYTGKSSALVYEPGFCFLALACKFIWNSYVFFQIVCCAVNIALLHLFLRRTVKNENLGISIFLLFGGLVMMTNLMRNTISILLIANSLVFIDRKKPLLFFSICLLAGLFHSSALLCLPLYWLLRIKSNKWCFLGVAMFANTIFILRIEWFLTLLSAVAGDISFLITEKASTYAQNFESFTVLSIGFIERTATTLILFLCYDKLAGKSRLRIICLNMYLIYLLMVMGLWENAVLAERLSYMSICSYWILWPALVSLLKSRNDRLFIIILIAIYGSMKMIGFTHYPKCQYDNHLLGARTYSDRIILFRDE